MKQEMQKVKQECAVFNFPREARNKSRNEARGSSL